MTTPNLQLVWAAQNQAPRIGQPKEPPPTLAARVQAYLEEAAAETTFVYDWEERLRDVSPVVHPKMRFDQYGLYRDKLFTAVKILNATPDMNSDRAAGCVLDAFWRLRQARRNQNELNREDYRGRSDYDIDGEDMEAMLELMVATPRNSQLRAGLEEEWFSLVSSRDTETFGERLRSDLNRLMRRSRPQSDEVFYYAAALARLDEAEMQRAQKAMSGLHIIRAP